MKIVKYGIVKYINPDSTNNTQLEEIWKVRIIEDTGLYYRIKHLIMLHGNYGNGFIASHLDRINAIKLKTNMLDVYDVNEYNLFERIVNWVKNIKFKNV